MPRIVSLYDLAISSYSAVIARRGTSALRGVKLLMGAGRGGSRVRYRGGAAWYQWYMDVWAHAWETPFHFEKISELTCAANRGTAGNPLFILNHFLTLAFAVPEQAPEVNGALLGQRASQCRQQWGRLPNFVTVDFYSVGTLFETTRMLNGL